MPATASISQTNSAPAIHRSVLNAALTVAAAGVAVKLAAMAKEIAVAGVYGRSDDMDAFLVAALVPALLVNLISESMNQALVPTLVRVREVEGKEPAQRLLASAMFWMSGLLIAASLLMAAGAHAYFPLIASHFPAAKLQLSVRLFYGLPSMFISGIAANCTAVLNTMDRFAAPAVAPIFVSFTILLSVLLLGSRFGIWVMVGSTVAGSLVYAATVAAMMQARGYRFSLRWSGSTQATREVAAQHGPVLLSSVVASGGLLVDQAMAAMLPSGSVSALAYANRFVSVVLTLLAGALSTALTPHFSRQIANRDWLGCRRTLSTWSWRMAAVAIPIAFSLIVGSRPLVRIAFERGAFRSPDTAIVSSVLAMYAIQIPFFAVSRVSYRFIIAMRRSDLVLYCGVLNLVLDVILNIVLMRRMGVAGIALATSLWTVSTFLFLALCARYLLKQAKQAMEAAK